MDIAYDFHIHSALSPCASNDMTPNNIVNMALLKGLDAISITDHNSCANLPSVMHAASLNGITLLPGIEVQTREEVHVLCYFKSLDNALELGNFIYSRLPDIKADEDIFGEQLVLDFNDNITGKLDKLLLSSTDISLNDLFGITNELEGICIPAHINRKSYSILSNLGFIPQGMDINNVEISGVIADFETPLVLTGHYRIIRSSDAHSLGEISERTNYITLETFTLSNLFEYLCHI